MSIIFISEHYTPRIGGVTTYVKNIVQYWGQHLGKVTLIVPDEGEKGKIITKKEKSHIEILVGVGCPLTGNIPSQIRKLFISQAFDYLKRLYDKEKFDAIHLLFGLYTMQHFNFQYFRNLGIKCGVTIHNIPPAECGISWKGDNLYRYFKDEVRKIGVGLINRKRIQKQKFDFYIVPSQHVKNLLAPLLHNTPIHVIGHGIDPKPNIVYKNSDKNYIQILCVGGFVPHKKQDVLIDMAVSLQRKGLFIHWILVGPVRNTQYLDYINYKISQSSSIHVDIKVSIPQKELKDLYLSSDMYVQPSIEEGFCLTALDAAAYGLPIVGTSTGALPEIISKGAGITAQFSREDFEKAIISVINSLDQYKERAQVNIPEVMNHFNWRNAVFQLKGIINRS